MIQAHIPNPKELEKKLCGSLKKELFPFVRRLAKKCNSLETAQPLFISTAAKFQDGEDFLLLCGKLNAWKAYIKQELTSKEALHGLAYISKDEEGPGFILNIIPKKGQLKKKEGKLQKLLKKIIPPAKLRLHFIEAALDDVEEESEEQEASDKERPGAQAASNERRGLKDIIKNWKTTLKLLAEAKGLLAKIKTVQGEEQKDIFKKIYAFYKKATQLIDLLPQKQQERIRKHPVYIAIKTLAEKLGKTPENKEPEPKPQEPEKPGQKPEAATADPEQERFFERNWSKIKRIFKSYDIALGI